MRFYIVQPHDSQRYLVLFGLWYFSKEIKWPNYLILESYEAPHVLRAQIFSFFVRLRSVCKAIWLPRGHAQSLVSWSGSSVCYPWLFKCLDTEVEGRDPDISKHCGIHGASEHSLHQWDGELWDTRVEDSQARGGITATSEWSSTKSSQCLTYFQKLRQTHFPSTIQ